MKEESMMTTRRAIASGMRQTLPIVLGYIPVGFAYGVLAQKSGLDPVAGIGMSIIVFAGSAQLIAAGLFGAGASPLVIIITTFVVNLRHLLMSAALAPRLQGWRRWQIALFGYELTDETFALHSLRFARGIPAKAETFAINGTAQGSWVAGTVLGYVAGGQIADIQPIGLDFALPAMFIALLIPQLQKPVYLVAAILAGILSVVMYLMGTSHFAVILATILASTFGLFLEKWMKRK